MPHKFNEQYGIVDDRRQRSKQGRSPGDVRMRRRQTLLVNR